MGFEKAKKTLVKKLENDDLCAELLNEVNQIPNDPKDAQHDINTKVLNRKKLLGRNFQENKALFAYARLINREYETD